ncbi:hypothetical protein BaRGS_00026137 [Batillaria attramentaria]|uniref:VWFA domain-containing protein n=1 Tax=Batillaria attramentaria TaxID=370345 RepID=A0ABD0K6Y1_9CAEN
MGDSRVMAEARLIPPSAGTNLEISSAKDVEIAREVVASYLHAEPADSEAIACDAEDGNTPGALLCENIETCCLHREQTLGANAKLELQNLTIAEHFHDVAVHINKDAAQLLNANKTKDAVVKCLTKFKWNGKDLWKEKLKAFRLDLKDKSDQLLKEVVEKIYTLGAAAQFAIEQTVKRVIRKEVLGEFAQFRDTVLRMMGGMTEEVRSLRSQIQHHSGADSGTVVRPELPQAESSQQLSSEADPSETETVPSSSEGVDSGLQGEGKEERTTGGVLAQDSDAGDRHSVMSPGGNVNSSIVSMEYGQRLMAQKEDEKRDQDSGERTQDVSLDDVCLQKSASNLSATHSQIGQGINREDVVFPVKDAPQDSNEPQQRDASTLQPPKKTVQLHTQPSSKSDVEATDDERKSYSSRSDGKTPETPPSPRKTKESIMLQAEQLLNWVNVKSKASQSKDPEINRMMDQVMHSLEDEEDPAPKARALDTVLVLDTSDSVVNTHLDELKTVAHTFIDGIEEIVDTMNLEENLAVIQMGDRAWVRQHLTNDYARVRDVIDEMTPDSEEMKTGGRTPIFQALMVCLGAIEGRGGVVNVAGCHRVRPRIIFFSDGRPTDEATEHGSDVQSNVNEVKFALVQLISEFASKKHKTTPTPIFWVPVGKDPDHPFLKSLAALSGGKVVEPGKVNELCRYYKVQETIGCVFKMVKKHTDVYQTDQQMKSIIEALAGNLEEEEKNYIMEEVRKKQKEPDSEPGEADDFDNVFEDKELVESGSLPPLGTRVVRGKDWKWNNQDTEGPGTVIQHRKKRDSWLHIMWDNGTHNAYRYGDGDFYDVKITQDYPRQIGSSELIEIGVVVRRGDDWKDGEEDGNETGVVIRKRKDGKVKVRWANGHIGKYRFGADGKFEVRVVDPPEAAPHQQAEEAAAAQREPEELQGAVGGYDPSEGESRRVWYWKDGSTKEWHMYSHTDQEKLKQAYARRKDGSCVINREGKNRRVLFKTNQEKTVDKGLMHEVDSKIMSEREYRRRQGLDSDDHEREQPLAASVGHEFMLGKGAEPSFRMPPGKDWKVKSPPPGQEWKGESSSDSGHGKSSFPQQQSKPQIPELRTQTRHQEKHEERGDGAVSDDATSKHMPRNVRDADPTRQEQS